MCAFRSRTVCWLIPLVTFFVCPPPATAETVPIDAVPHDIELETVAGHTEYLPGRTVDIVGDASNAATNVGVAKGNSYRVDMGVVLNRAEFWLNFSSTQTLTYYLFSCPSEFGVYSEVWRDSETVTGTGAGWYPSTAIDLDLSPDNHYIIAVSWNGTMTYYYGVGDEQPVSFGSYVHGYATGSDPLPSSFSSTSNDQAIYHQRLTTNETTPAAGSTWGEIKALYQ